MILFMYVLLHIAAEHFLKLRQAEKDGCGCHGDDHFGQHVSAVIANGIEPRTAYPLCAERNELFEIRKNDSAGKQMARAC